MQKHEFYLRRCIELARKGMGHVAPNPMVGSVIVHQDRIIGEGYHQKYGENHAERNAIFSVKTADLPLLSASTLYVNLEPCAHHGKTPPCADLIVSYNIPKVVIGGSIDPNPKVSGKGIERLQEAGIEVITGVLVAECDALNRYFYTAFRQKRPYVVLKWAQTKNAYFAPDDGQQKWISNQQTKRLTHQWRAQEQAILVGTNTAVIDNPKLNVRLWIGEAPLRLAIDRNLKIPATHYLLDGSLPTVIFTAKKVLPKSKEALSAPVFHQLDFEQENILPQILTYLHQKGIHSLIVEGGANLLQTFIEENLWDEARVFIGNANWASGLTAPKLPVNCLQSQETIGNNQLHIYQNPHGVVEPNI